MEEIYKQALNLQNKFRSFIDQPNHPVTQKLKTEIQKLTDEIEVHKNPRSLEDRVKEIMHCLEEAEHEAIMDNPHIDDLHDICREIQQELRHLM